MSTTPVHVPPSPMSLGGVFTATFSVFRRRIGAFLALTGLQQLVSLVALIIPVVLGVVLLFPYVASSVSTTNQVPAAQAIGLGILIVVGGILLATILSGIISLYFDGMMITCANEATQGRFPTLAELRTLSKGYVGRIVGLYLLAMLAYLVAITLISLPLIFSLGSLVAIVMSSSSSTQSSDAALAVFGVMALTFFLMLAVVVGAFVLGVKVAYVAQVCAVERLSGFAALRRAWALTKGAFWRTFGYLLVFSLAAGAVQQGISFVMQIFIPTMSSVSSSSSSSESAVFAMLRSGTLAMVMGAVYAVAVAISLVMVPLRHTFVTVMYGDQLRRQQLGPVNHAFVMNVPAYGQQAYGYPQGYGYPPPGPRPGYAGQPGPGTYAPPPSPPYGQPPQQPGYGQPPQQPGYGQQPPYQS